MKIKLISVNFVFALRNSLWFLWKTSRGYWPKNHVKTRPWRQSLSWTKHYLLLCEHNIPWNRRQKSCHSLGITARKNYVKTRSAWWAKYSMNSSPWSCHLLRINAQKMHQIDEKMWIFVKLQRWTKMRQIGK